MIGSCALHPVGVDGCSGSTGCSPRSRNKLQRHDQGNSSTRILDILASLFSGGGRSDMLSLFNYVIQRYLCMYVYVEQLKNKQLNQVVFMLVGKNTDTNLHFIFTVV